MAPGAATWNRGPKLEVIETLRTTCAHSAAEHETEEAEVDEEEEPIELIGPLPGMWNARTMAKTIAGNWRSIDQGATAGGMAEKSVSRLTKYDVDVG